MMPPRVRGELPGMTPRIHVASAVVRPRPEETAFSAAFSRERKGEESAESADSVFLVPLEVLGLMAEEKSMIFFSPA